MLDGLTNGFRVGFNHQQLQLCSRGLNHPSSLVNEAVVEERITTEITEGRLLGPLSGHLTLPVHISPLGLVPKPHQPNKFRLIVDLSHPAGGSVNDGIDSDLCSLHYATVHDAVSIIKQLGRDTQLAKLDMKDAYRIVPIHPADYHLLGITWKGETYIDRALPFGLSSAPKIFNAVADLITWVLHQEGIVYQLHYLDDFLLLGAPHSQQAADALAITLRMFHSLGIPIASNKTEGPATTLSFLRQLFPLLALDRASHHIIRLNEGARADLLWWRTFLEDWNGTSFFPTSIPAIEVISDASGSYGCGAFSHNYGWFQLEWPESWQAINITAKELVPVILAAALWGHQWKRSCVCFRSDNMAVVDILKTRASRDPVLMHLLRCLVFYAAYHRFQFTAQHVPGVLNTAADAISRNNIPLFLSLVPQMPCTTIPQLLLELLVTKRPNWGSTDWTRLFAHSLSRGSQSPHVQSTSLDGSGIPSSVQSTLSPHY